MEKLEKFKRCPHCGCQMYRHRQRWLCSNVVHCAHTERINAKTPKPKEV
jgi:ribosomal protein S27AE